MLTVTTRVAKRAAQSGATLIEILVTVVIMSIGLLSLASLQAFAIAANQNAINRSLAAALANDYADMLRANPIGFAAGSYDKAAAFDPASTSVPTISAGSICTFPNCTPQSLGVFEQAMLTTRTKATLKAGAFAMSRPGGAATQADLWIMWTEQNNAGAASNQDTFDNCPSAVRAVSPLPRCFYMRVSL